MCWSCHLLPPTVYMSWNEARSWIHGLWSGIQHPKRHLSYWPTQPCSIHRACTHTALCKPGTHDLLPVSWYPHFSQPVLLSNIQGDTLTLPQPITTCRYALAGPSILPPSLQPTHTPRAGYVSACNNLTGVGVFSKERAVGRSDP